MTLTTTGCAEVVGIEDFSVDETSTSSPSGGSSGMMAIDPCGDVHGCTRDDAIIYTGELMETINVEFKTTGYEPRCIRIRTDQRVNFNSDGITFQEIPIQGGIFPNPDPKSPIQPPPDLKATEMIVEFPPTGCGYPYYSPSNGATLQGVVYTGG